MAQYSHSHRVVALSTSSLEKAVCAEEALRPEFRNYAAQVVRTAQPFADENAQARTPRLALENLKAAHVTASTFQIKTSLVRISECMR